jgi:hypothetical protein
MKDYITRWRLRMVCKSLQYQTELGLKKEVLDFAYTLEATLAMCVGQKKTKGVVMQTNKKELMAFINYMTRLHQTKLSLLHRARIGVATLFCKDEKLLGEDPIEFWKRELKQAKSAKEDRRIQLIK